MSDGGNGKGAAAKADAPPESIAGASLAEAIGVIALVGPTWRIMRHPLRFEGYRTDPAQAIHYVFAATVFVIAIEDWTAPTGAAENPAGNFSHLYWLLGWLLGALVPGARIEPSDFLPVTLLLGNIVAGVCAYAICRGLRNRAVPTNPAAAAQTIAATAYLAGACAVLFGVGAIVNAHAGYAANGPDTSPPQQVVGFAVLLLAYCWGQWIRRIHQVAIGNRVLGFLLPFAILLISLAVFALLAALL